MYREAIEELPIRARALIYGEGQLGKLDGKVTNGLVRRDAGDVRRAQELDPGSAEIRASLAAAGVQNG